MLSITEHPTQNHDDFSHLLSHAPSKLIRSIFAEEMAKRIKDPGIKIMQTRLMDSVVDCLVCLRDAGKLTLDVSAIRSALVLEDLYKLSKNPDAPDKPRSNIEQYIYHVPACPGDIREAGLLTIGQTFREQYRYRVMLILEALDRLERNFDSGHIQAPDDEPDSGHNIVRKECSSIPLPLYDNDAQYTFISLPPGHGKTTMLLECCLSVLKEEISTALLINFGKEFEIPERYTSIISNPLILNIKAEKMIISSCAKILLSELKTPKRVCIINIDPSELAVNSHNLQYSIDRHMLSSIIKNINALLPSDFKSELKYILVDEAQKLNVDSSRDFESSLWLLSDSAKAVIASQVMIESTKHDAGFSATLTNGIAMGRSNKFRHCVYRIDETDTDKSTSLQHLLSYGSAELIITYMQGLLNARENANDLWIAQGTTLFHKLIEALCYLRDRDNLTMDIQEIRGFLPLDELVRLTQNPILPESMRLGFQQYMEKLPGFLSMIDNPENKKLSYRPYEQHGFRIMAWSAILSDLEAGDPPFPVQKKDCRVLDIVMDVTKLIGMKN